MSIVFSLKSSVSFHRISKSSSLIQLAQMKQTTNDNTKVSFILLFITIFYILYIILFKFETTYIYLWWMAEINMTKKCICMNLKPILTFWINYMFGFLVDSHHRRFFFKFTRYLLSEKGPIVRITIGYLPTLSRKKPSNLVEEARLCSFCKERKRIIHQSLVKKKKVYLGCMCDVIKWKIEVIENILLPFVH